MTWRDTAPYKAETKDRWLRLNWAAKHFAIDRAALLNWAKTGTVEARQSATSGRWEVRESSLRSLLFVAEEM